MILGRTLSLIIMNMFTISEKYDRLVAQPTSFERPNQTEAMRDQYIRRLYLRNIWSDGRLNLRSHYDNVAAAGISVVKA